MKGVISVYVLRVILSTYHLERIVRAGFCLVIIAVLFGCKPIVATIIPTSSPDKIQISTASYLTETPVPACVMLPDVRLIVTLLSDNSVQIKIVGLKSYEPVYTIFSSESEGKTKKIECCEGETASGNGNYQYTQVLRSQNVDNEFKDWQVQIFHSRGATCTNFTLP